LCGVKYATIFFFWYAHYCEIVSKQLIIYECGLIREGNGRGADVVECTACGCRGGGRCRLTCELCWLFCCADFVAACTLPVFDLPPFPPPPPPLPLLFPPPLPPTCTPCSEVYCLSVVTDFPPPLVVDAGICAQQKQRRTRTIHEHERHKSAAPIATIAIVCVLHPLDGADGGFGGFGEG